MEPFSPLPIATWQPTENLLKTTHIAELMQQLGFKQYSELHRWSVEDYPAFWQKMINTLGIVFDENYKTIIDPASSIETPIWFPDAKLNISNSCFTASPADIAILSEEENGLIIKTTYGELDQLSNQVANSITTYFKQGDKIAILMPMSVMAIAIFFGIIKAGCAVVSIPESFSPDEIATRLRIANAKGIFTEDYMIRDTKKLSLYGKACEASAPFTIVLSHPTNTVPLRDHDIKWQDFLSKNTFFKAVSCDPANPTTILFSSGTTGDPKAIPWTHTTPIKCGSDAYLHHNIQAGDILCWPTSLGWMMGPWLVYASLLNQATIAIYEGTPQGAAFGKFVQDAGVTMLGVVPTLVKSWRISGCMEKFDWSQIRVYSSTGECSNPSDMSYLMSLTKNQAPVIEYCGGTEIGGAYITSTLIQANAPGAFTTPALGIDFVMLDENGLPTQNGEVALIPPSIGLSTTLLNKDHHEVYFANMPTLADGTILRRHGDQVEKFSNGFYQLHGRVDDTMNLSGIKISSAEIETVLNTHPALLETAAVAITPMGGGPSQLVIYAIPRAPLPMDVPQLKRELQQKIKQHLNPLFKIYKVIMLDALPRTASNKVMRRLLRQPVE